MTEADKTIYASQVMTEHELATLGGGVVAYIKTLTADEASRMFPTIEGLPTGINLFSLHAADGTPLCITDDFAEATRDPHAVQLRLVSVH